jgi:hypothetical protein
MNPIANVCKLIFQEGSIRYTLHATRYTLHATRYTLHATRYSDSATSHVNNLCLTHQARQRGSAYRNQLVGMDRRAVRLSRRLAKPEWRSA